MGKEKNQRDVLLCPVGRFFMDMEESLGERSVFFQHMNRSKTEFLKAMRTIIDERIERLEKKASKGKKRNNTRIEVE